MLRLTTIGKLTSRVILQSPYRTVYTTIENNDDSKNSIKVPTKEESVTSFDSSTDQLNRHNAIADSIPINPNSNISTVSTIGSSERSKLSDDHLSSPLKQVTESKTTLKVEEELAKSKLHELPTPKVLKRHLDEYIIGQDATKKIISVALYKHQFTQQLSEIEKKYNVSHEMPDKITQSIPELEKSNILLVGPSGSGKTLIAKTLAKVLKLPISITDCTSLTQAGFVGEDCESCIEKLLINANYDVDLCERGIVVLDEVDKLAKPAVFSGTKDIAGEGVQQGLLKLIEGANVAVKVKNYVNTKGPDSSRSTDQSRNNPTEQQFMIDTSNILFISMGAFIGLDQIIAQRFKSSTSIGFDDNESRSKDDHSSSAEISSSTSNGEDSHFQGTITRLPDDELKSSEIAQVKLANGNKISALQLVSPTDLQQFGLIPELIGRLPILTALDPLSINNLVQISTEPKNAIVRQYEYFFSKLGVRLAITSEAIKMIAKISILNGTGARGLRSILEKILLTVNYDCPGSGISFVLIDREVIDRFEKSDGLINGEIAQDNNEVSAKYFSRGEIFKFLNEVENEDLKLALAIEDEYNIPKTSFKKQNATG